MRFFPSTLLSRLGLATVALAAAAFISAGAAGLFAFGDWPDENVKAVAVKPIAVADTPGDAAPRPVPRRERPRRAEVPAARPAPAPRIADDPPRPTLIGDSGAGATEPPAPPAPPPPAPPPPPPPPPENPVQLVTGVVEDAASRLPRPTGAVDSLLTQTAAAVNALGRAVRDLLAPSS